MASILKFLLIEDLYRYPNLFKKLVYRDFFERFVGSALGFLWAILNPLVLMGMYVLLFSVILKIRFVEGGSHIDFGLYLFCGMIPWLAFQESLTKCTQVILGYRHMILHIRFPLGFLPLHIAVSALVQELIALFLFVGFVSQYQGISFEHLLYVGLIIPVKFIFTCGINFFLAPISVFYRDIVQLVQILMIGWFFLSPIVYPLSKVPETYLAIYELNPFVPFIKAYRFAVLAQGTWNWGEFFYIVFISIFIFALGRIYFQHCQNRFIGYL